MYGINLTEDEIAAEKFYTMSEAAKVIGIKGLGRNKLLELLRNEGILRRRNEPYQIFIDGGYFKYVIKDVTDRRGRIIDRPAVSLVSAKGMEMIKGLINKKMRMKSEKKVYVMKEMKVDDVENLSFDAVLNGNGAGKPVPVSKAPAYVITGQQLLKNKVAEIPTLIEPIFPKVGVAAIAGASDTGKSSFLRQMAMAIVSGEEEFQNFKINAEHKSVIYLSTEDDELAVSFLLAKQNNGKHEDRKFNKLRYIFESDNVLDKLEKELEREPADCIFIDAFSDLYDGQMNETNKIRSFLNRFSDLAKKYQCLIIFLHHTAKRSEESAPSKNNLLGSQGFEAKMRLVIELRKDFIYLSVRHLCIVKGNYLKSEFKEKSYVLKFDEQMLFTNLDYRMPFEKLSKPSGKSEDKAEVLEKISKYKTEGYSLRKISEKLKEEGFKKVGKSAVAKLAKSVPPADDSLNEKGEESNS